MYFLQQLIILRLIKDIHVLEVLIGETIIYSESFLKPSVQTFFVEESKIQETLSTDITSMKQNHFTLLHLTATDPFLIQVESWHRQNIKDSRTELEGKHMKHFGVYQMKEFLDLIVGHLVKMIAAILHFQEPPNLQPKYSCFKSESYTNLFYYRRYSTDVKGNHYYVGYTIEEPGAPRDGTVYGHYHLARHIPFTCFMKMM